MRGIELTDQMITMGFTIKRFIAVTLIDFFVSALVLQLAFAIDVVPITICSILFSYIFQFFIGSFFYLNQSTLKPINHFIVTFGCTFVVIITAYISLINLIGTQSKNTEFLIAYIISKLFFSLFIGFTLKRVLSKIRNA